MITSENKKFLYIAVPKTGTTFIENHLREYLDDAESVRRSQNGPDDTELHKHSDIMDLNNLNLIDLHTDKFKVAFVRNPFDKIVSWFGYYIQRHKKNKTKKQHIEYYGDKYLSGEFIDFVKYGPSFIWKNSVSFLIDNFGKFHVDFIGRYENLYEDMNYICDELKIPKVNNKKYLNKSKHDHYTSYYCNESKKIVSERMRLDIEFFNYKFGEN